MKLLGYIALAAFVGGIAWNFYVGWSACADAGGVYVRTPLSYECVARK